MKYYVFTQFKLHFITLCIDIDPDNNEDNKVFWKDATPGHTQVLCELESSESESDADSCRKQGYKYDEGIVDPEFMPCSSDSSSTSSNDNGNDESNIKSNIKTRAKGGRPLGSTLAQKQKKLKNEAKAKYKIC